MQADTGVLIVWQIHMHAGRNWVPGINSSKNVVFCSCYSCLQRCTNWSHMPWWLTVNWQLELVTPCLYMCAGLVLAGAYSVYMCTHCMCTIELPWINPQTSSWACMCSVIYWAVLSEHKMWTQTKRQDNLSLWPANKRSNRSIHTTYTWTCQWQHKHMALYFDLLAFTWWHHPAKLSKKATPLRHQWSCGLSDGIIRSMTKFVEWPVVASTPRLSGVQYKGHS